MGESFVCFCHAVRVFFFLESGTFTFEWTGDNGFSATESAKITVE